MFQAMRFFYFFVSLNKEWNILTSLNLSQHFRLQMNEREAWKLPSNAYIAMVPSVITLTKSLGNVCIRSKFEVKCMFKGLAEFFSIFQTCISLNTNIEF